MIGGYSIIRGGVGNPAGGAMGLVVIAGVTDIIAVKSINTYYTDVIVGILLLLAVLLDRIRGGDAYE
jgi:ribose/xylose/arabinose/galactoside ABC-type transport system permease subunit